MIATIRRVMWFGMFGALALTLGMGRVPPEKKRGEKPMDDGANIMVTGVSPSVWSGGNCGVGKPESRVIEDGKSWAALWREEFATDAPDVDFSEHFAVAVFLGLRNTGGYSVEFLPPVAGDGEVRIGYRVSSPSPSGFVIQAFTQPYAIQLYRKTPLKVTVGEVGK
ncbi:protease complex subunit PrcB family protein [Elusimicrobiota bacterium]